LSWLTRGNISPWTMPAPAARVRGRSLGSVLLSEGQIMMDVRMGKGGHQSSTGGHHLRSGPRIPCCRCGRQHRTTSWSESRIPCGGVEETQGSCRRGTSCSPDSSQSRPRCRGGEPPSCRCPLENRPCGTLLGWVQGFRPTKSAGSGVWFFKVVEGCIQGFDGATASAAAIRLLERLSLLCTFVHFAFTNLQPTLFARLVSVKM